MPSRPSKQYKANAKSRKNTVLYPHSHDIPTLSRDALALKIARHSRCPKCEDCTGLRPKSGLLVALDSDFENGISPQPNYISHCRCGHSVAEHASSEEVSSEEFERRGRVAVRLDELLEDEQKLLDFDYEDEDIVSLRKQIVPLEEGLSPLSDNSLSPGM
ncbi:hypothetical protein BU17DRAFT_52800 [Hysterangium stoloniferum]|nr:hypothetical protein BU17DRAFT_52800 [Hysterangium stoloniferum]